MRRREITEAERRRLRWLYKRKDTPARRKRYRPHKSAAAPPGEIRKVSATLSPQGKDSARRRRQAVGARAGD